MPESLLKLSAYLLAMKLCYHNAHHVASRISFFADHEAFGDFYSQLDDDYDSVVERMIGLYSSDLANLQKILSLVSPLINNFPSNSTPDNSSLFSFMLNTENGLVNQVELICKSPECKESTKQLISEIGNKAEMRIYKIKQRIKK